MSASKKCRHREHLSYSDKTKNRHLDACTKVPNICILLDLVIFNSSCSNLLIHYVWQIPRDILLEVLGPSKVYKEVIKKVINSTISAYVEKVNIQFFHSLIISVPPPPPKNKPTIKKIEEKVY